VQQFKARLVCEGNHEIEGINSQAMYALTGRLGHARLALMISSQSDLKIHQTDVCPAFFGVHSEVKLDTHPLQGYFCFVQTLSRYNDPTFSKTSRKIVLRLRQSLDGLEQSSQGWYGTCKDCVISIGFVPSPIDGGLHVLHDKEDHSIVVATVVLYVHDLPFIANRGFIGQIMAQMNKRFQMHDLRGVSFHLGMDIDCILLLHTIDIHQHSYIQMILVEFRMDESRSVATPMAMKCHKSKPNEEACNLTINQSMIGRLMYVMTGTRPNVADPIGILSHYNHDTSSKHMVALKHVFLYLNGTTDQRLCFSGALGGALEAESPLGCYVNSDHAGCPDGYKLTSGLGITFGGAGHWRSRQQE